MTIPQLVSHHLCPYVQRAAIAFCEKGAPFARVNVDLSDKPAWFTAMSPLGKVPVLRVDDAAIFESAVILEFLEDTIEPRLHPADAITRADHRAWIEFGSAILNTIAGLYSAADRSAFDVKRDALNKQFWWVERRAKADPWFDGRSFSLVDATFGPIFRYFDVFDTIADFGAFPGKVDTPGTKCPGVFPQGNAINIESRALSGHDPCDFLVNVTGKRSSLLHDKPKVGAWRAALAARPSVRRAVEPDYPQRLSAFLRSRKSHISSLMAATASPHSTFG